jgi:hypothetical protein
VSSCLVTAYDFLIDSGTAINNTLGGFGLDCSELINDQWVKSDLIQAWPTANPNLVSVNAHFEHWAALPAQPAWPYVDVNDLVKNTDLLGGNITDQIAYSMGCHATLNVPDDFVSDPTRHPDLSQVFAQKGAAAWIGNLGYGYGIDDAVAFSEELNLLFTEQLGTVDSKPVGKALMEAKQRYVGVRAATGFGVYDEKSMTEATLFGLPMVTVSGLGAPAALTNAESQTLQVTQQATALVDEITVPITTSPHIIDAGKYYSVEGEVEAFPGRPIQPRTTVLLSPGPNNRVAGVVFKEGTFTDESPFDPVITMPFSQISEVEPVFDESGWFPIKLWTANRFGDQDQLVIVAGQYNNDLTLERRYSSMTFDVNYAPLTSTDFVPPSILSAGARKINEPDFSGLEFFVGAFDDEGVARVLVTYLEHGQNVWRSSENLVQDQTSGGWFGRVAGLDISTPYFVQACDTTGNCTFTADKSDYLVGSRPNPFTNVVGEPHTYTITVWKDEGSGLDFVDDGVKPDVTLVTLFGASFNITENTCSTVGTVDGQCTVTFNSTSTGVVSAHADVDADVLGVPLVRSTNGDLGNSLDAIKNFVNATILLEPMEPSGTVEVNEDYSIKAIVKKDLGDGGGLVAAEGEFPVVVLQDQDGNSITPIVNTCVFDDLTNTGGTDELGECIVTFTLPYAGQVTATVNHNLNIPGLANPIVLEDSELVTFFDGRVVIDPLGGSLGVGENHTLAITAEVNDGSGWTPISFTSPTYDLTFTEGQTGTHSIDCGQEPFTQCQITFSANSDGVVTISVTLTFNFDGAVFTRSSTTSVTYVAGTLAWSKVDNAGALLAGASFDACRVAERPGTPALPSPECVTVTDNDSLDVDPDGGEFKLENLKLGTWEIRETIAPEGYMGDLDSKETYGLDIGSPNGIGAVPWVNYPVVGKILETGTTCEDYINGGTDFELNDVIYRVKQGKINNVAPGVFFYYTKFTAPADVFTVQVNQSSIPEFTPFHVQNLEQVRLFNDDCSIPTSTFTSTINGDVNVNISGAIANNLYIMSVKYETGNVVGEPDPGDVLYSYTTKVGGVGVDKNGNGLNLKKKGN